MLTKVSTDHRNRLFQELYKAGHTLQEIGDTFKVTRERVRQVLRAYGVPVDVGGRAIRGILKINDARARQFKKQEKKERKCRATYGCSCAEVEALGPPTKSTSPAARFVMQRRNAKTRKIPWLLTLPEWWDIWRQSGHWSERGKAGFVMARYGDSGPYSAENVRIITASDNTREARQMDKILGRIYPYVKRAPMVHCKRGHELAGKNIYVVPKTGTRLCRICASLRAKKYLQKKKRNKRGRGMDGVA